MKKSLKRILCVMLSLAMALSYGAVYPSASSDPDPAEDHLFAVGTEFCDTLQAAIDLVEDGGTIIVTGYDENVDLKKATIAKEKFLNDDTFIFTIRMGNWYEKGNESHNAFLNNLLSYVAEDSEYYDMDPLPLLSYENGTIDFRVAKLYTVTGIVYEGSRDENHPPAENIPPEGPDGGIMPPPGDEEPLAGVKVSLEFNYAYDGDDDVEIIVPSVETDENGKFTIGNVEAANYKITAEKDGYVWDMADANVDVNMGTAKDGIVDVNKQLPLMLESEGAADHSLGGIVISEDSVENDVSSSITVSPAAADGSVYHYPVDYKLDKSAEGISLTVNEGSYTNGFVWSARINVSQGAAPGEYTITATDNFGGSKTAQFTVSDAEKFSETVQGKIINETGNENIKLEDIHVRVFKGRKIVDEGAIPVYAEPKVDSEGSFTFTADEECWYTAFVGGTGDYGDSVDVFYAGRGMVGLSTWLYLSEYRLILKNDTSEGGGDTDDFIYDPSDVDVKLTASVESVKGTAEPAAIDNISFDCDFLTYDKETGKITVPSDAQDGTYKITADYTIEGDEGIYNTYGYLTIDRHHLESIKLSSESVLNTEDSVIGVMPLAKSGSYHYPVNYYIVLDDGSETGKPVVKYDDYISIETVKLSSGIGMSIADITVKKGAAPGKYYVRGVDQYGLFYTTSFEVTKGYAFSKTVKGKVLNDTGNDFINLENVRVEIYKGANAGPGYAGPAYAEPKVGSGGEFTFEADEEGWYTAVVTGTGNYCRNLDIEYVSENMQGEMTLILDVNELMLQPGIVMGADDKEVNPSIYRLAQGDAAITDITFIDCSDYDNDTSLPTYDKERNVIEVSKDVPNGVYLADADFTLSGVPDGVNTDGAVIGFLTVDRSGLNSIEIFGLSGTYVTDDSDSSLAVIPYTEEGDIFRGPVDYFLVIDGEPVKKSDDGLVSIENYMMDPSIGVTVADISIKAGAKAGTYTVRGVDMFGESGREATFTIIGSHSFVLIELDTPSVKNTAAHTVTATAYALDGSEYRYPVSYYLVNANGELVEEYNNITIKTVVEGTASTGTFYKAEITVPAGTAPGTYTVRGIDEYGISDDVTLTVSRGSTGGGGGGGTAVPVGGGTTVTDSNGNTVTTAKGTDGSTTTTMQAPNNGQRSVTTQYADGRIISEITVPKSVTDAAGGSGSPVRLVVPSGITAVSDTGAAPEFKIDLPSGTSGLQIAIPIANAAVSTVAVLVNPDGTEEVIPKSVAKSDGTVNIIADGDITVKIISNARSFGDVPSNHWAGSFIDFVSSHALFNGMEENVFAPDERMTRYMFAQVMYNMNMNPTGSPASTFGDIEGTHWAKAAVDWAVANKIVNGYSSTEFGGDNNITREDIATILYRLAGSPAVYASLEGALNEFSDAVDISEYARSAMVWAANNGIMTGMENGILAPQADATRAQVAAMIERYIRNILFAVG